MSLARELVIVVDENDREIRHEEKLLVHTTPTLHRAVSVFIFNRAGQLLLQRRANVKYHSPGLWSNTCCGHPRPGETTTNAARRRLVEEMGLECALFPAGAVRYAVDVGGGLEEHEFVHIFTGLCDDLPRPDPEEVSGWRWVDFSALTHALGERPREFTAWFRIVLGALAATPRPRWATAAGLWS